MHAGGEWKLQEGSPFNFHRGAEGQHFGANVALSADGNSAVVSGLGKSGIVAFEREGESWSESAPVREGISGKVALSADGDTLLTGGGGTYKNIGTAIVFVRMPWTSEISPRYGLVSGGTRVRIKGGDFNGATGVLFGSTPATSFTVESRGEIIAMAPPAPAGSVSVKVANAVGGSTGEQFTYGTPPHAPTDVHAKAGEGRARVTFKPGVVGEESGEFTVTASPGGAQATGRSEEATVMGLKDSVKYTFTVTATNEFGTGPPSAPSNAVVLGQIVLGATQRLADGAIELKVNVPGPGVLSADQVSSTPGRARRSSVRVDGKVSRRVRFAVEKQRFVESAHYKTNAEEGETANLTLEPTVAALRALAYTRTLDARVRVSFIPKGGETSTIVTKVVFLRPGYSFERGSEGWEGAWGDLAVSGATAYHHTGRRSLRITIHTNPYSAVNVAESEGYMNTPLGLLRPGVSISMWVYRPANTPPMAFRAMVRVGKAWTECRNAEVWPQASSWVRLSITVPDSSHCRGPAEPHLEVHGVGVEIDDKGNVAKGKSVYLDDVSW